MYSAIGLLLLGASKIAAQGAQLGQWTLAAYTGVSVMHITHSPFTDKTLFLERTELATEAMINGQYTYAMEFDTNSYETRPLTVRTNMFCSSGSYLPNGTVMNFGGGEQIRNGENGYNAIRSFTPCLDGSCDWVQTPDMILSTYRWYPTVETLADGTAFILGGSNAGTAVNTASVNVPSWELYPYDAYPGWTWPINMQYMIDTLPNNLYPIAHLLPTGDLYILAGASPVIFSTQTWTITTRLPNVPGPIARNYPLTGGSILFPLDPANQYAAEVMVCGGGNVLKTTEPTDPSCARLQPLAANPQWTTENMPQGRVMPDVTITTNGQIYIVNGAQQGTAGFGKNTNPALNALSYDPSAAAGKRFTILQSSVIPRMYHSVAIPNYDGTLIVTGSNPNNNPNGEGPFPTDYRLEIFHPPYLLSGLPQPIINDYPVTITYSMAIPLNITTFQPGSKITASLMQTGFVTHSTHMSQRFVWLTVAQNNNQGSLVVTAPPHGGIMPEGPCLLAIQENGIPSHLKWVMMTGPQPANFPIPSRSPVKGDVLKNVTTSSTPAPASGGTAEG